MLNGKRPQCSYGTPPRKLPHAHNRAIIATPSVRRGQVQAQQALCWHLVLSELVYVALADDGVLQDVVHVVGCEQLLFPVELLRPWGVKACLVSSSGMQRVPCTAMQRIQKDAHSVTMLRSLQGRGWTAA